MLALTHTANLQSIGSDGNRNRTYLQVRSFARESPTPSMACLGTVDAMSIRPSLLIHWFDALAQAMILPGMNPPCLVCFRSLRGKPWVNSTLASDQLGAVIMATFRNLWGKNKQKQNKNNNIRVNDLVCTSLRNNWFLVVWFASSTYTTRWIW